MSALPTLQDVARLVGQGQPRQAAGAARQLLCQRAGDPQAWQLLGTALLMAGEPGEAVGALERSLELNGRDARTCSLLGVAQSQLGEHAAAVASFDRAVGLAPDQPQLWCDRARALHAVRRFTDALTSTDRALALQASLPQAWLVRGNVLRELDQLPEAVTSLQTAASLAPDDTAALHALAEALFEAKRWTETSACCEHALSLAPAHAGLWISQGNAEQELAHPERAAACYERACQLAPEDARGWVGRARALVKLGRFSEAVDCLERGVARDPQKRLFTLELMRLSQEQVLWDRLPLLWPQALAAAEGHEAPGAPFFMLAHPQASGADLLRGARATVAAARLKLPARLPAAGLGAGGARLRVGYLSGDLRDHAVSYLMAGVFEAHDRARFDVVGIDLCPKPQAATPLRQRVTAAFDPLLEVGQLPAGEIAARIRELRLDVLIDLMGATSFSQAGVLLRRPAPLQVTYLGFPGTSGMNEIDYLIGDRWVAPPGSERDFSEQLVRLPDSFQANDDRRRIAEQTPTRASLGLPEQGFVFCCHNNTYKILPRSFDIWMRLLERVPGSVLWLVQNSDFAAENLRAQARRRGVDPARLVFARRLGYEAYLAQYRQADLFLDTLPFNAGTTASDALWAGLPVLTQLGQTFAGRMAASLLHNVGLPELVTRSDEEYEALALRLATEPGLLRGLRERLTAQRLSVPLFNTRRFTRHLEWALTAMCERNRQGLPPASFDVPALPV